MRNKLLMGIPLQSYCKGILFSLLILSVGCQPKNDASLKTIQVTWKNNRAVGLSIPKNKLDDIPEDSLHTQMEVRLAKHGEQPPLAGNYIVNREEIIFEPVLPFTRGLRYAVYVQHKLIDEIEIPKDTTVPKLLAIYPGSDSLPENLLKIYLLFSRPMQEGQSLQYIKLTNDKGDSLPNTFLGLQSELWNQEGTLLTLWLNPGRIKRDLQPNKLLGSPLVNGQHYHFVIGNEWPDIQGTILDQDYTKSFVATLRDSLSPSLDQWKLKIPPAGTRQPLEVMTGDKLDYILLQNTITIVDSVGKILAGEIKILPGESGYEFKPVNPWTSGIYKIQIEARLADLAGNNLNRLFDLDLKNNRSLKSPKEIFEIQWKIDQ